MLVILKQLTWRLSRTTWKLKQQHSQTPALPECPWAEKIYHRRQAWQSWTVMTCGYVWIQFGYFFSLFWVIFGHLDFRFFGDQENATWLNWRWSCSVAANSRRRWSTCSWKRCEMIRWDGKRSSEAMPNIPGYWLQISFGRFWFDFCPFSVDLPISEKNISRKNSPLHVFMFESWWICPGISALLFTPFSREFPPRKTDTFLRKVL